MCERYSDGSAKLDACFTRCLVGGELFVGQCDRWASCCQCHFAIEGNSIFDNISDVFWRSDRQLDAARDFRKRDLAVDVVGVLRGGQREWLVGTVNDLDSQGFGHIQNFAEIGVAAVECELELCTFEACARHTQAKHLLGLRECQAIAGEV